MNMNLYNKLCIMVVMALLGAVSFAQSVPLGARGTLPFTTANVAADTATLANSGVVGLLTATPTAAAALTTPTAVALCAYMRSIVRPTVSPSFNWDLYIKNTSAGANTITFTAGVGVTITGTATIVQNSVKHFVGVLTNCAAGSEAVTFVSVGTSVF